MNPHKQEKMTSVIIPVVAEYLNYHGNGSSMITVTNCIVSDDLKRATVYITVLPDAKEAEALNFAKRQRSEIREYLKKKTKIGLLPFIDIEIDQGEKHRQRIDELLKKG